MALDDLPNDRLRDAWKLVDHAWHHLDDDKKQSAIYLQCAQAQAQLDIAVSLHYIYDLLEQNPANSVFNRTPTAASFVGRCLVRAGNWLIKLSERAG